MVNWKRGTKTLSKNKKALCTRYAPIKKLDDATYTVQECVASNLIPDPGNKMSFTDKIDTELYARCIDENPSKFGEFVTCLKEGIGKFAKANEAYLGYGKNNGEDVGFGSGSGSGFDEITAFSRPTVDYFCESFIEVGKGWGKENEFSEPYKKDDCLRDPLLYGPYVYPEFDGTFQCAQKFNRAGSIVSKEQFQLCVDKESKRTQLYFFYMKLPVFRGSMIQLSNKYGFQPNMAAKIITGFIVFVIFVCLLCVAYVVKQKKDAKLIEEMRVKKLEKIREFLAPQQPQVVMMSQNNVIPPK